MMQQQFPTEYSFAVQSWWESLLVNLRLTCEIIQTTAVFSCIGMNEILIRVMFEQL